MCDMMTSLMQTICLQEARNRLLTHFEIQQCVDAVNQQVHDEGERVEAVRRINDTLAGSDAEATLAALQLPEARMRDVDEKQKTHYHRLLKALKNEKAQVRVHVYFTVTCQFMY